MQGVVRVTTPDTQRALLRANGLPAHTDAEVAETLAEMKAVQRAALLPADVVIESNTSRPLQVACAVEWTVLADEDNRVLAEGSAEDVISLPPLPDGVHTLRLKVEKDVEETTLIVAPEQAPSLGTVTGQQKIWGCVAALYGIASTADKTLGDYNDLAELASVLGGSGAGFLGVNPVHALGCAALETISPYSPTHRGFLNTDHIALPLPLRTDSVDPEDLLNYATHRRMHGTAMRKAFSDFQSRNDRAENSRFEQFCAERGKDLDDFALFEHLSESHGPDWRAWPAALQNAHSARRDGMSEAVLYHKWLQWQADSQLATAQKQARDAGMSLGLYLDLAVGARLGGAESWGDETSVAQGVSIGAPPDHLSPAGQNWQLSAFAPRKLQASRYKAFRQVLRQNMQHCGLLRIDHALGLSRSFWIPEDGSPGGYVQQPFEAFLAIVALEARRAGTVIVGEDLGLVPAGFRADIAARGFYGYSVMQYEKDNKGAFLPVENLRAQSLACFGTHDTPTLAGYWAGHDIAWWEKLGWITTEDAARAVDTRATEKRALAGLPAPTPLPQVATAGLRDSIHSRLAESPAAMVAVQLDDILLLKEAQNLPGTVDEHPNWRRRYPSTLSDFARSKDLRQTAGLMERAGRSTRMRKDQT